MESTTPFKQRSPFKDLSTQSNTLSTQRQSFFSANTSSLDSKTLGRFSTVTMGSQDLLQARIDHLEKERLEMSMQMHNRQEAERSKNFQIIALEQSKQELAFKLESIKGEMRQYQNQKDIYEAEIKRLNRSAEAQVEESNQSTQTFCNKLNAAAREIRRLEGEVVSLSLERDKEVSESQMNIKIIGEKNEKLRAAMEQTKSLEEMCKNLKQQFDVDVAKKDKTLKGVQTENSELNERMRKLEALCEELKAQKVQQIQKSADIPQAHDDQHDGALQETITQLRDKLTLSERERRKLHNQLQELRGNIRVFVRCRPFLAGDGDEFALAAQGTHQDAVHGCLNCNQDGCTVLMTNASRGSGQMFSFDHVFNPDANQQDVFKEVSEVVQSALDGYR